MSFPSNQRRPSLTLAKISLILTALIFGVFGVVFLLWPEAVELTGVALTTPAAATEIRGFYGGMEIGFAIFFALAASRQNWFHPALIAQTAAFAGMALGRIFGLIVDGEPETLLFALIAAETTGATVGAIALWRLRGLRASTAGLLHHVEIYVSDLQRSRQFWQWFLGRLGYDLYQEWDNGFSLRLGPTYLVFVQTDEDHQQPPYHRCRTGLNHLAFHASSADDVDLLTEELKARDITILYEDRHPHAGGPDSYGVFFEDPDRIKVEYVLS